MKTLKELTIKGYHINQEIHDQLGSVFYDTDNPDNYLEISPVSNVTNLFLFSIIEQCQPIKLLVHEYYGSNDNFNEIEQWINKELEK